MWNKLDAISYFWLTKERELFRLNFTKVDKRTIKRLLLPRAEITLVMDVKAQMYQQWVA